MEKTQGKQIKKSSDRSMQRFFFPKANPPVTIEAESVEEAEKKLQALTKHK